MSSITIREVLASDSISIMVDKLNFNFDQFLLNGGGPPGNRGLPGGPGTIGPRGLLWFSAADLWTRTGTPVKVNIIPPTIIGDPNKFYPVNLIALEEIGNISKPLRNGDYFAQESDDGGGLDGDVWEYNSVLNVWELIGLNLKGPIGRPGIAPATEWSRTSYLLKDYIYTTPVFGQEIPRVVVGKVDPLLFPLNGDILPSMAIFNDDLHLSLVNSIIHTNINYAPNFSTGQDGSLIISGGSIPGVSGGDNNSIFMQTNSIFGESVSFISLGASLTGSPVIDMKLNIIPSALIGSKAEFQLFGGQLNIKNTINDYINTIWASDGIKHLTLEVTPVINIPIPANSNNYIKLYASQDHHLILNDGLAKNIGIGNFTNTIEPKAKLSVNGNFSLGSTYSTHSAPINGGLIQSQLGISSDWGTGSILSSETILNQYVKLQIDNKINKTSISSVPGVQGIITNKYTSYLGFNITGNIDISGDTEWQLEPEDYIASTHNAGSALLSDVSGALRIISIPTSGTPLALQLFNNSQIDNYTKIYIDSTKIINKVATTINIAGDITLVYTDILISAIDKISYSYSNTSPILKISNNITYVNNKHNIGRALAIETKSLSTDLNIGTGIDLFVNNVSNQNKHISSISSSYSSLIRNSSDIRINMLKEGAGQIINPGKVTKITTGTYYTGVTGPDFANVIYYNDPNPLLIIGQIYKISYLQPFDDFTNVGAKINKLGEIFTATGTTPFVWKRSEYFGANTVGVIGLGAIPDSGRFTQGTQLQQMSIGEMQEIIRIEGSKITINSEDDNIITVSKKSGIDLNGKNLTIQAGEANGLNTTGGDLNLFAGSADMGLNPVKDGRIKIGKYSSGFTRMLFGIINVGWAQNSVPVIQEGDGWWSGQIFTTFFGPVPPFRVGGPSFNTSQVTNYGHATGHAHVYFDVPLQNPSKAVCVVSRMDNNIEAGEYTASVDTITADFMIIRLTYHNGPAFGGYGRVNFILYAP